MVFLRTLLDFLYRYYYYVSVRRRLEKMAEAKAGVYALKEKLEVLFELFLYVCLVLETSTSKQTRRSREDKCIVYILLLRSGVESNPGPRTWIDDIPAMQMATTGDLINLASCIGNGWRQLGLLLNVGEATLDHIEHDNKTMQEKIYRMLQKSPFKDSLMEMLLIIDDACNKGLVHVNWNDISDFISKYGQEQPTIQRDVAYTVVERLATLENQMTTVQTTQAELADLKNKFTCLQAENKELKTEIATLKRGAEKRNNEEGETSTGVKRVKHQ